MGKRGSTHIPTGDYEVGYCRPPEMSRFTKGSSGNPKGRPKKAKDSSIGARALLAEKLRMRRLAREGGVEVARERIDILIDQQLNAFGAGRIRSLKPLLEVLEWFDKYGGEQASSDGVDYRALVWKKLEDMAQRQRERRREDRERKKQGLPPLYKTEDEDDDD